MVAVTPEEQQKIKEILEKEGLEEFFKEVVYAHNHEKALAHIIETKRKLEELIRKFDDGNSKPAFEKAENTRTFIYVNPDRELEIKEEPIIMNFEEFVSRYHPNMIWHKNGKGTYSTLMGKYRFFAKNYKVVIFRLPDMTDRDALRIALKLSKNIYIISRYDYELMPRGFALFIP
jgi:hypothetical protein